LVAVQSGQRDLVDWLEQAKVIAADFAARFRKSKDQRALDGVAGRAREFRGCKFHSSL